MQHPLALTALLFAPSTAFAAEPACVPLSEAEFVDRIQGSLDLLEAGEVDQHWTVVSDVFLRLECAQFLIRPEQVAKLFVGIAVAKRHRGESWEKFLDTAYWIEPRIDLPVGPGSSMWLHVAPPAPPLTETPVPEGSRFFWNGEVTEFVPKVEGLAAVGQRRTHAGWETKVFVDDQPIPAHWLREPTLLERQKAYGEFFAGASGSLGVSQMQAVDDLDYLKGAGAISGGPALHLDGKAGLGFPLGLQGRLWLPLLGPLRGSSADFGFFWRSDAVDVYLGASARGLEGVDVERHNQVGVGGHLGIELHFDHTRLSVVGGIGNPWGSVDGYLIQPLGKIHVSGHIGYTRSRWQHRGSTDFANSSFYIGGISVGFGGRSE